MIKQIVLIFFFITAVFGQKLIHTSEDLDAAFVFLISKNITWPNESKIKKFHIAIVNPQHKTLKAFKKMTKGLILKKKPIVIDPITLNDLKYQYKNYQVIFYSQRYAKEVLNLVDLFDNYPLLLISKNCNTQKFMIDLHENEFNKIDIRVNPEFIHKHNLSISNEIILTSGKRVGISKLFETSIRSLKKQEKSYKEYLQQNNALKKEIQNYKTKLTQMQSKVDSLQKQINTHHKLLQKQRKQIKNKDKELTHITKELKKEEQNFYKKQKQLKALLNEYTLAQKKLQLQQDLIQKNKSILQKKEALIKQKEKLLTEKEKLIAKKDNLIKEKQTQTQKLDLKIKETTTQLQQKNQTIKQQSMVLYLLIFIVMIIVLFAFYIYRTKNKYAILNEELAKAKEKADYANRSKSIFLANMSHELRTPLNAILGFSQLLSKDDSITNKNKKLLQNIYKAGTFLLALINDVLDISKIEAGKVILHEAPTDLKQLLNDIVMFTKSSLEKKGLELNLKLDEKIPQCIIADKDKLRQIILNYVTNAIKYSEKGIITISLKIKENKLLIEVSDMGHGIKEEELQDIFKPFIQVGKASEHTGTGLGLTITKRYVQSMGGDVAVKSVYKKGSAFYATIPYKICKKTDKIQQNIHHNIIGVEKPQKPYTSLIVDDNETNRELLAQILTSEVQSKIVFAHNGYEAIELFEKFHPQIIWIDKKMPYLNGEEATRAIRKLKNGKDVIIIGLTASIFEEDEKQLLEAGMDEIILKPYELEDIYKILHKYFGLDYIYEDTRSFKKETAFSHKEFINALEKIDKELLQKLYEKALLLEKDEIEEMIEEISEQNQKFAQMLLYLVDEMQYGTIINSVSTYLQKHS